MNIKITHNWLLEYLETDASPYEIQKYLSLCGPSVEKVEKAGNDFVYDIEVTSNRVDMASVFGIALESQAILPQFGKKAKLLHNPLKSFNFSSIGNSGGRDEKLKVEIKDKNLCSRFAEIILDNVHVAPSPNFIRERLNLCGIKSINNVVDISNYLMLALGQPVHVFDYDSIGRDVINHVSTMIMRESGKGEKIVTLDGKTLALPGSDIIIEDGKGQLIDLCGIMGGLNSAVTSGTKRIILFVQTYNAQKLRRTSMLSGQHTIAASYFEKGLDEERVEPTLVYGVRLLQKYAEAKIASKLCDIYPKTYKKKSLVISYLSIEKIIGIEIPRKLVDGILKNLGFSVDHLDNARISIGIPSWRSKDIAIKEDIVEEVARIYGYRSLPAVIQSTGYVKQPKDIELLFEMQSKVKFFLKHIGLNEVMNYSMISKKKIENMNLSVSDHLRIKNTISEDIEYMRRYITGSLIKSIKENEGRRELLKLFEIAKGYMPRKNDLPLEYYQLSIVINTSLPDLKGILDALIREFHIDNYKIKGGDYAVFEPKIQGEITVGGELLGKFGKLNQKIKISFNLKSDVYIAYFKFETFAKYAKKLAAYKSLHPYAVIKLDLTIAQKEHLPFAKIKDIALKTSKCLNDIELVNIFQNKITLRFYFSSPEKNLTEEEAKKELEKIKASCYNSRYG